MVSAVLRREVSRVPLAMPAKCPCRSSSKKSPSLQADTSVSWVLALRTHSIPTATLHFKSHSEFKHHQSIQKEKKKSLIQSKDCKIYILACINVYWGLLTICNFKYWYSHKVRKLCKISYCVTSGGRGLIKILTIRISERTGLVLTFSHCQAMWDSEEKRFLCWLSPPVLQNHP